MNPLEVPTLDRRIESATIATRAFGRLPGAPPSKGDAPVSLLEGKLAILARDREEAKRRVESFDIAKLPLEELVGGAKYGKLQLSKAQRALCRAADGLPVEHMDRGEIAYHFGVSESILRPPERPRVVMARCGVRSAKSLIGAFGALLKSALSCSFRWKPRHPDEIPGADGLVGVRPGELVRALVVAPVMKAARQPFHHLIGSMKDSPFFSQFIEGKPGVEHVVLRRPDGALVHVELAAASSGGLNLRSTWLAGILFDEADFHDEEDAAVNLVENYRAVTTRILDGGQIWIVSSPWADEGPFHSMFTQAFGNPGRTVAFHSDSLAMNPTLDRKDIEAERARDPENAAREFDAVPLSSSALGWFPKTAIEMACSRTEETIKPTGRPHFAGCDLGFRKNSSALAIACAREGKVSLAFFEELIPAPKQTLKPSEVIEQFAKTCLDYRCSVIHGDQYVMDTSIEQFAWHQDPTGRTVAYEVIHAHPDITAGMFERFRQLMIEGQLELPDNPRLRKQLEDTKKKRYPNGKIGVVLPKHGAAHADLLVAVVLACVQVPIGEDVEDSVAFASSVADDFGGFRWDGNERGFG